MIKKALLHSRFWHGIAFLATDCLYFGLTDPRQVVAGGLIIGLLLITVTFYYLFDGLLAAARLYGLSFGRHRHRFALFVTVATGGLLGMQSMGQLSIHDTMAAGILAAALYLYLGYGRAGRSLPSAQ